MCDGLLVAILLTYIYAVFTVRYLRPLPPWVTKIADEQMQQLYYKEKNENC
jgi:hypothetical protein